jgi:hypothetical protein
MNKKRKLTEFSVKARLLDARLNNWTYPDRDSKAELHSLSLSAGCFQRKTEPDTYHEMSARVATEYPHIDMTKLNDALDKMMLGETTPITVLIYEAINAVVLDKTPGAPCRNAYGTNQALFDAIHAEIVLVVIARLTMILEYGSDLEKLTSAELVAHGFVDPAAVSVKQELNAERKSATGNWRLIYQVSVVDQIIQRVLSTKQNKTEIRLWNLIPSKPGIGFSDDDIALIRTPLLKHLDEGNLYASDIKGWDKTVQHWEHMHEADDRAMLANAVGTKYHTCLRAMNYCISNAVYVLSNGDMYAKTEPGQQISGQFNTSSGNSRIRVKAGWWAGADFVVAMGDDANETSFPNARERYALLGKELREYTKLSRNHVEFCSQIITSDKIYPADTSRSLHKLLDNQADDRRQLMRQFNSDNRHSPTLGQDLSTILASGWATASAETLAQ